MAMPQISPFATWDNALPVSMAWRANCGDMAVCVYRGGMMGVLGQHGRASKWETAPKISLPDLRWFVFGLNFRPAPSASGRAGLGSQVFLLRRFHALS